MRTSCVDLLLLEDEADFELDDGVREDEVDFEGVDGEDLGIGGTALALGDIWLARLVGIVGGVADD